MASAAARFFDLPDVPPNEEAALAFSQELLDFSIELVIALPSPPIVGESPRDPGLIGRTLLCRSITNFRGAIVLLRHEQPVECRSLVRLIFENSFFVASLIEHGADFVRQMRSDEAANRKKLGEHTLKRLSATAKEGEHAQIIRTQIRSLLTEFPKPKKFSSVSAVASSTAVENAYLSYSVLSMDAHPSVSALRRHLQWEMEGDTKFLTVNVAPTFRAGERLATIKEACSALLFVCVAVNQLVGGSSKNDDLKKLFDCFEALGLD